MKILIVKTSAIGDVTHTLPALNALRAKYPAAHISWLVEEAAADIIKGHPALDRVLVSARKKWIKQIKEGAVLRALADLFHFIRQVRDTRYDLIIDFQNLLKSSVFVWLAKGDRKVGYGRGMEHSEFSYIFLNERIPPVNMDQHAVLRELLLLNKIGIESDIIVYELPVSEQQMRTAETILSNHSYNDKAKLVAINPVAGWDTKLWENNRFAAVADSLLEKGYFVFFTGSIADIAVVDDISSRMNNETINLAGKTSLKELAALYKKADVLISTDTGPMHIAAAVGTPVVALFGPTASWRTGPFGDYHEVLRGEIECSPCLKRECDSLDCMTKITVEQVIKASEKILAAQ